MLDNIQSAEFQQATSRLDKPGGFSQSLLELQSLTANLQGQIGRAGFPITTLARFAIEQIIQYYIEDDKVDIRPFITTVSQKVRALLSSDLSPEDFFTALTEVLLSVHDIGRTPQIKCVQRRVDVKMGRGIPVTIKAWITTEEGATLPVSRSWYPFVPILEENVLDPDLAPSLIAAFAAEVGELARQEKVTCLGFIEKPVGPVGALLLAPALTAATGLPGIVFREGQWSARSQIAGSHSLTASDRVLLVYDLVVSGGGLKHAAETLNRNFGVETPAAVVLFSYHDQNEPHIPYTKKESGGLIRVRPLARYQQVQGWIDRLRKIDDENVVTSIDPASAARTLDEADSQEVHYTVSENIAGYVRRGIQAGGEVARKQFIRDEGFRALSQAVKPEDIRAKDLQILISNRLRRMFRSIASLAREEGFKSRTLSARSEWCIDVEYEIIERVPVRPGETGKFLQALRSEIVLDLAQGKRLSGTWGELSVRKNELVMTIEPVPVSPVKRNSRGTIFRRNVTR